MKKTFLISAILAAGLSACGGSDSSNTAGNNGGGNGGNGTPVTDSKIPTLAFTDPQSSFDLNNYTQTAMFPLQENTSGANLLNAEASGVTYDKDTDSLFVIGDGATSVVQVSKSDGHVIDSMTLNGGDFEDTEGITYAGGGKFVLVEERLRQVDMFTYVPNGTLNRAAVQSVKLGTTVGNVGIEGVTFDTKTGGYIAVRQSQPTNIFQAAINFAAGTATASDGTPILPSTDNPPVMFDAATTGLSAFNDVFSVSNIVSSTAPDYDNVVIIGAPDGRIVKMDRAGNLKSNLYMSATAQNEGVTMAPDGTIYAVGEQAAGPSLPGLTIFKPTTGTSNVGIGSNLYLKFDQAVKAGSGNIVLSNGVDDTRTISVGDASQVTFSGNVMKIHPKFYLTANTTYHITYPAGAIKTIAGNNTVAVSDNSTFSFTTIGTVDHTTPTLSSTAPVDGATGIIGNHMTLSFSKIVQPGSGNIVVSDGSDTRNISVSDTSQVKFNGGRVTITFATPLQNSSHYTMQMAGGVITDLYGNPYAGTTQSFTTAAAGAPAPTVLISEVNSNADGGQDFFEIYNYGSAAIDLTGWRWGDSHADVNDANNAAAFPAGTKLAAGEHLVIVPGVPGTDENTFRTTWGLPGSVPVMAMLDINNDASNPIGLGKGDAVIVYDANGNVAAAMNYGTPIAATQGDGTTVAIPTALGTDASLVAAGNHAGAVFVGGNAKASAVWDTVSPTTAPNYIEAVVGALNGIAEPTSSKSVGSPGD
ncbi:SdiA-regulated domain-containing protein [Paraburkholderia sp. ZP32-5]|uniref:SdiA-regulated domain-containing protein n=1 Tax=Paraburkholderia sp. ZP32-5 TaxID=2883245 RepID=UPI001F2F5BA2|nr:SdiA-regulated domain-containing protein [Paraburkholderia sp. ZP32-5]